MAIRIIPCLQLMDGRLVKTTRFKNPRYIGDPLNSVRIFNEMEVDELCFLDINASVKSSAPNYELLQQISDESFMPISYGGGIDSVEKAKRVFDCGFEKVVLNTAANRNPPLVSSLAKCFGSQAVVVAIDVDKNLLGQYRIHSLSGKERLKEHPLSWAKQMEEEGAGEILLTSIDREGTWKGFDLSLIKEVSSGINIPVIAHGGAGNVEHIRTIVAETQVSAVALGSMLIFQKQDRGILINYPKDKIEAAVASIETK